MPRRRSAFLAVALAALSVPAEATTYTWISATSGNWSNPAKWTLGQPPVSADDTIVEFDASAAVTANQDIGHPLTLWMLRAELGTTGSTTLNGNPLRFVIDPNQTSFAFALMGIDAASPTVGPLVVNNDLVVDAAELRLFSDAGTANLVLNGALTGSGRIVSLDHPVIYNGSSPDFTGILVGTSRSAMTLSPSARLGPSARAGAENTIHGGGRIIYSPENFAVSGSVALTQGGFAEPRVLNDDSLRSISTDSRGAVGITTAMPVDSSLDLRSHPHLRIGVSHPDPGGRVTFSATILPADNTYRFGGNARHDLVNVSLGMDLQDTLNVTSLLPNDPSGAARSLNIGANGSNGGGKIRLANPANTYSGGTVIERNYNNGAAPTLLFDYTPAPGATPLGSGPVTVKGALLFEGAAGALGSLSNPIEFLPGSELLFNNITFTAPATRTHAPLDRWPDARSVALNGTALRLRGNVAGAFTEKAGALSYDANSSIFIENFGAGTMQAHFDSLTRQNRGTLLIRSAATSGFDNLRTVRIDNADAVTTDHPSGMLHPSIVFANDASSDFGVSSTFLRRDAQGVLRPVTYATSFDATDSEVVNPGFDTTISTDQTVFAMHSRGNTISAGRTLTIGSGGLILGLMDTTLSGGNIAFARNGQPVEALIHSRAFGDNVISSAITTADGVTFHGDGVVRLTGDNSFTGPVTINDTILVVGSAGAIPAGAPVHVNNGGMLSLNGNSLTVGALSGSGIVDNATGSATLTVDSSVDSEFSGQLIDRVHFQRILSLVKTGPGTLTLSGVNQRDATEAFEQPFRSGGYSGLTTVQQGALILRDYALRYGPYRVEQGGTLRFETSRSIQLSGDGHLVVGPGATLSADHLHEGKLSLEPGARFILPPEVGDGFVNHLTALDIHPTATLQLADQPLIVQADPAAAETFQKLTAAVASARNSHPDAPWTGPGVTSSFAAVHPGISLAVVLNQRADGAPLVTDYFGQFVDASSILFRNTYDGDANLDGRVSIADYLAIDRGIARGLAGWQNGDFDYSGKVDALDYFLIDQSFLNQGAPLGGGAVSVASPGAAVPEPAAITLLAVALPLLRRRRGRPM